MVFGKSASTKMSQSAMLRGSNTLICGCGAAGSGVKVGGAGRSVGLSGICAVGVKVGISMGGLACADGTVPGMLQAKDAKTNSRMGIRYVRTVLSFCPTSYKGSVLKTSSGLPEDIYFKLFNMCLVTASAGASFSVIHNGAKEEPANARISSRQACTSVCFPSFS